jgi:nucleotidyltransferase/DNA polymerase involved in DNA repair
VRSLLDHHQPGRHNRALPRREPICRQPGADARRVSRLQSTDRAQRTRRPRTLAIRSKIKEVTGLNASAGISYNKFLAKLASDYRKPNGQYAITPEMGRRS